MRIGIDVHSLGSAAGGNETYYRGLLKALQSASDDNSYCLYASNPIRLGQGQEKRFEIRHIATNRYLRVPISLPIAAKRDRLDIFHAQFIVPPGLRCRTVATIPDIAFEHFPEWFTSYQLFWSRRLIRRSAARADHVITVSEYSKSDLVRMYNIDPQTVTVTYPAPDDSFYPRDHGAAGERVFRKYGVEGGFILYVGRLQGRKNLGRLVDAYAQVRKAGYGGKLVLVGKRDTLFGGVDARIARLNLAREVVFLGYVAAFDLPWIYSAADLFVYPSIYEGFGLPVVEAMACGTAVVTTYSSSLEEIAAGAALLFDPSDTASLSDCVQRILNSESLRFELSRAGLAQRKRFTHEALGEGTIGVYERVLGAESPASNRRAHAAREVTECR